MDKEYTRLNCEHITGDELSREFLFLGGSTILNLCPVCMSIVTGRILENIIRDGISKAIPGRLSNHADL